MAQQHPQLYGLDPLFRTYVKLLICQLDSIDGFAGFDGQNRLFSHPITRVEVVGDVIGKISFYDSSDVLNRLIFQIDDGSGIANCVLWASKKSPFQHIAAEKGQLVTIMGKVSPRYAFSRNFDVCKKEITIEHISVEKDPNVQILHWYQTATMMELFYCNPPKDPLLSESLLQVEFFDSILECCRNYISKYSNQTITMKEILASKQVNSLSSGHSSCEIEEFVVRAFGVLQTENVLIPPFHKEGGVQSSNTLSDHYMLS